MSKRLSDPIVKYLVQWQNSLTSCKPNLQRRIFLKGAAFAGGCVLAPGLLGNERKFSPPAEPPSEQGMALPLWVGAKLWQNRFARAAFLQFQDALSSSKPSIYASFHPIRQPYRSFFSHSNSAGVDGLIWTPGPGTFPALSIFGGFPFSMTPKETTGWLTSNDGASALSVYFPKEFEPFFLGCAGSGYGRVGLLSGFERGAFDAKRLACTPLSSAWYREAGHDLVAVSSMNEMRELCLQGKIDVTAMAAHAGNYSAGLHRLGKAYLVNDYDRIYSPVFLFIRKSRWMAASEKARNAIRTAAKRSALELHSQTSDFEARILEKISAETPLVRYEYPKALEKTLRQKTDSAIRLISRAVPTARPLFRPYLIDGAASVET